MVLPLRAIFRRAHKGGDVAINPTVELTLPAVAAKETASQHQQR